MEFVILQFVYLVIVFSCKESLKNLARAEGIGLDGTFSISPKLWTQVAHFKANLFTLWHFREEQVMSSLRLNEPFGPIPGIIPMTSGTICHRE